MEQKKNSCHRKPEHLDLIPLTSANKDGANCLITETQLALRWGVSVKKIQSDRWKGTGLPAIYIGRCVRYSAKSIEEFERVHTFNSTTEAQHRFRQHASFKTPSLDCKKTQPQENKFDKGESATSEMKSSTNTSKNMIETHNGDANG